MLMWIIKRYAISAVNDVLKDYAENVDTVKDTLNLWISRIDKVLFALRSLLLKLDDNQITDEEVEKTVEELSIAIKEW